MGLGIETVAFRAANPGATFTAVTMATSDSASVRVFRQGSRAFIEHLTRQGATSGAVRVLSPTLHDNVTGLTYITAETPSVVLMPDFVGQPVQPGDPLTIQLTGGTAETEVGSLTFYYEDVQGVAATLYNWADVQGAIEHLKPLEVDCSIGGTAGVWADTLMNATDKNFKADRRYALLGWTSDTAMAAFGIHGAETGNLRIGGPCPTTPEDTAFWFVLEGQRHQTPHIPVLSANNFQSTNVSVVGTPTSGTAKIILNLALLKAGF